jgi:hypothetical protein
MDISQINNLFTDSSLDLTIIEQIIRQPGVIDNIIDYIRGNIIANTAANFSQLAESEEELNNFNQISDMFIGEGKILVQNLSKVLHKYITIKSNEFVNVDLTNTWYVSEKPIIQISSSDHDIISPFYNKPLISKVLTILTKLVDYICTFYTNKIQIYKYVISENRHQFSEVDINSVSVFQYSIMKLMTEQKIEAYEQNIVKLNDNLSNFNEHTQIVRSYYIKLFDNVRLTNTKYLHFLPRNVLDIFDSFLSDHIKLDSEILNFYLDNYHMMPTSFRSKYISLLIHIIHSINAESKFKESIYNFLINEFTIASLFEDASTLYDKINVEASILNDIIEINHIIHIIFSMNNPNKYIKQMPTIKLIKYTSMSLSMMAKILELREKISSDQICFDFISKYLIIISHIIKSRPDIMDSFLVFKLPTFLYDYYSITCLEESKQRISMLLDEIFNQISSVKLVPIYLANLLSDSVDNIEQIKGSFSTLVKEKIFKWIDIYKKISSDKELDDELIDPLTSNFIVIPCYIPMNEDQTMTKVCDQNMISSYLLSKPENPFTRQTLTIDDLMIFNQSLSNKENKDKFNQKLKEQIKKMV